MTLIKQKNLPVGNNTNADNMFEHQYYGQTINSVKINDYKKRGIYVTEKNQIMMVICAQATVTN